ncbi:hypothetical protein ABW20_dc0109590 [Dactylellina cionopaga]|nr:hypothetical protein ABW20_dc0109590 [Dactylellina cionopaga]
MSILGALISPFSVLTTLRNHVLLHKPLTRNLSSLAHSDIPSFLRYAHVSGLKPTKTVFTGTLYEYTVLSALSRLPGISLIRVGGRDDAGVDLQGVWELPKILKEPGGIISETNDRLLVGSTGEGETVEGDENAKIRIPLIVQCKNVREKGWKGPQYVRELEGALANHPIDALGVLASVRDMTPGMRKQMLASRRALGFIKVTPLEGNFEYISPESEEEELEEKIRIGKHVNEQASDDEDEEDGTVSFHFSGKGGLLQQFAWNEVANRYLGGFGIGARYVPKNYGARGIELGDAGKVAEDEALEEEITLTWKGVPMFKS